MFHPRLSRNLASGPCKPKTCPVNSSPKSGALNVDGNRPGNLEPRKRAAGATWWALAVASPSHPSAAIEILGKKERKGPGWRAWSTVTEVVVVVVVNNNNNGSNCTTSIIVVLVIVIVISTPIVIAIHVSVD